MYDVLVVYQVVQCLWPTRVYGNGASSEDK
jgi:hypothetical protein